MVKIKRSVIQIANSTQLISLPRKWSLKYNIQKGDELEIEERGNKISVSTEKDIEGHDIEVNPPHLKNITERYITTAFRVGIDEVRVNFNTEENPELLEYISKTLDGQTIGYEIIKQEKNSFTIKDLSGGDSTSFDTALRRSFIILTTMAVDSLGFMKNKDVNNLKDMYFRDRSINKFTNFCGRLLLKKGQFDLKETAFYYHFIRSFEAMADQYSLMCTYYSDKLTPLNKKVFEVYKEINDMVLEFYKLFYKYDKSKLDELFIKIKSIDGATKLLYSLKKSDPVVSYYLASITRRTKELIDSLIEFHIKEG